MQAIKRWTVRVAAAVGLAICLVGGVALFLTLRQSGTAHGPGDVASGPTIPHTSSSGTGGKPLSTSVPGLSPAVSRGSGVVDAPWGSGPGALGKTRPQEGNPEAPMSLTLDAQGNVLVVDQVNNRLARFDRQGKSLGSLPLTLQAAQDVQVALDGTTAVLDRLVDKSVALVGPDGALRGELPVVGKNFPEGGAATALVVDGNDVYLEREHGDLVRIGDSSGNVDPERPEIPGRPTHDGKSYISAGITDASAGKVFINAIDRSSLKHMYTRELALGVPVTAITFLDSDRLGIIYMALLLQEPGKAGGGDAAPALTLRLLCLDPLDGRPTGQATLPLNTLPEETFRDLTMSDRGGVLYSYRSVAGVQVQHHDCH